MKRLVNLLLLALTFVCFEGMDAGVDTICVNPSQVIGFLDGKHPTKGQVTRIMVRDSSSFLVKDSIKEVKSKLEEGQ